MVSHILLAHYNFTIFVKQVSAGCLENASKQLNSNSVVAKLIKICVHQTAKNKIDSPHDLILKRAANGGTT